MAKSLALNILAASGMVLGDGTNCRARTCDGTNPAGRDGVRSSSGPEGLLLPGRAQLRHCAQRMGAAAPRRPHRSHLCHTPCGAQFELLNSTTEISCNIHLRGLFLGGNVCD